MDPKEYSHIDALVLVGGISGAGKSSAVHFMGDHGFFIVDNLPVPLLPNIIEFTKSSPSKYRKTALLLDIDSREKMVTLFQMLNDFQDRPKNLHLVFLDCTNEVVIRRYSETRRPHPGFNPHRHMTLEETIQRERSRLSVFKERANFVLDTSNLTIHDLRRELGVYVESITKEKSRTVRINFLSFGFKYGLPADCDLIIDVRFIPNPYFVDALRPQNGLHTPVSEFVLGQAGVKEFIAKYKELLELIIPKYIYQGKLYLNVGVGCTGGQHRSVVIAETLKGMITHEDYIVSVKHRDLDHRSL